MQPIRSLLLQPLHMPFGTLELSFEPFLIMHSRNLEPASPDHDAIPADLQGGNCDPPALDADLNRIACHRRPRVLKNH
ncbi:MAG: hypothetical protein ACRD3T_09635 [Terriglobia bacterium]